MHQSLVQFAITAFVMLIVVVNPVAVAPFFIATTSGLDSHERRGVLTRAIVVAFAVALFFLLAGRLMLAYLGVTMHAFAVSGGILLFVIAMPMLFGHRSPLQSPDENEGRGGEDIAIFPLAIPMLAGPGTIATVLVLATEAAGEAQKVGLLIAVLVCVYLISWPVLHTSDRLIARIGEGRMSIITRVLGIILAALAVQYVFNGFTGYYETLVNR